MKNCLIVAAMVATLSLVTISCDLVGPKPVPTPTPTPMSVELCYNLLQEQRDLNVTRLEAMEGTEFRCEGVITEIREGGSVQFHISRPDFAEDQYVECEFFPNRRSASPKGRCVCSLQGRFGRGIPQPRSTSKECR